MPCIESLVVANGAVRSGRIERDCQEVFGRNAGKDEVRVSTEPEAAVVLGLPEHHAASRALLTQDTQGFLHEAGAHATTLMFGYHRDGTQSEPARRTMGQADRRHGHVPDERAIDIRYE